MDRLKEAGRIATKASEITISAVKDANAKANDLCNRLAPNAPKEVKNTVAGIATGLAAGLALGGVGVAATGTAFGVPAVAVVGGLASIGGLVGNRFGIWKDRRKLGR